MIVHHLSQQIKTENLKLKTYHFLHEVERV